MIRLVVNSDDFGMCHSVNLGVAKGFREGILTQASLMAPCPWFEEAAAMARDMDMPVGVHLTATCDWDVYRWGPVTGARSLATGDGAFPMSIAEARSRADGQELEAEFRAQVDLVISRGIEPSHIDVHMGVVDAEVVGRVCREYKLRCRYPLGEGFEDCCFRFDSYPGRGAEHLSTIPAERKTEWLVDRIGELTSGTHFVCGHLSVASEEIRSVCSPEFHARAWAQEYRASDLKAVTDSRVRAQCEARGVDLVSLREVTNEERPV